MNDAKRMEEKFAQLTPDITAAFLRAAHEISTVVKQMRSHGRK